MASLQPFDHSDPYDAACGVVFDEIIDRHRTRRGEGRERRLLIERSELWPGQNALTSFIAVVMTGIAGGVGSEEAVRAVFRNHLDEWFDIAVAEVAAKRQAAAN